METTLRTAKDAIGDKLEQVCVIKDVADEKERKQKGRQSRKESARDKTNKHELLIKSAVTVLQLVTKGEDAHLESITEESFKFTIQKEELLREGLDGLKPPILLLEKGVFIVKLRWFGQG